MDKKVEAEGGICRNSRMEQRVLMSNFDALRSDCYTQFIARMNSSLEWSS